MLKLAGETDIGKEKIELISYTPAIKDTGDLETGTHTIVPTSRPAIGSAQYSKSLTLPKPSDARLEVKRIAARLSVNIAGLGTATTVYCAVRVDVDNADHELFNESWTSTGAKLAAVDTRSGNKATIFDLLKDGAAHTFYFLFWADVASQATIDVVQLWEGVGATGTSSDVAFRVDHEGWVGVAAGLHVRGTGTPRIALELEDNAYGNGARIQELTNTRLLMKDATVLSSGYFNGLVGGTVATDLSGIYSIIIQLRSEQ